MYDGGLEGIHWGVFFGLVIEDRAWVVQVQLTVQNKYFTDFLTLRTISRVAANIVSSLRGL